MRVLIGRSLFMLKKVFNAFAFKNISCCDVGGMSSVLPTATISDTDDPHGCGKFPEAPGARRDVADEPTWMYSRRVAVGNTGLMLVSSKFEISLTAGYEKPTVLVHDLYADMS